MILNLLVFCVSHRSKVIESFLPQRFNKPSQLYFKEITRKYLTQSLGKTKHFLIGFQEALRLNYVNKKKIIKCTLVFSSSFWINLAKQNVVYIYSPSRFYHKCRHGVIKKHWLLWREWKTISLHWFKEFRFLGNKKEICFYKLLKDFLWVLNYLHLCLLIGLFFFF